MARPRKSRRVCCLPDSNLFGPLNSSERFNEFILMTVEEYETIRLMDLEGLNQEESAEIMGVARSTIQRIYEDARKKIAESLVKGKVLRIEGGDFELCNTDKSCGSGFCHRHGLGRNKRCKMIFNIDQRLLI